MLNKLKIFWKQFLCEHNWDKIRGYDNPVDGAECIKCDKILHRY